MVPSFKDGRHRRGRRMEMEGYSWGIQKDTISTRRNLEEVRSREARRSKDGGKKGNREG